MMQCRKLRGWIEINQADSGRWKDPRNTTILPSDTDKMGGNEGYLAWIRCVALRHCRTKHGVGFRVD